MKTLKLGFIGTLILASMFVAGCKDACKDVACVNGECTDGDCICAAGYTGADCATALNLKFNGSYNATEDCSISGASTFAVAVAPKSGAAGQVVFTRLYNSPNDDVTAVVGSDGLTFSIAKQDLGTSGFDLESTSGTISSDGKSITLAYKVYIDDTALIQNCTVSMTR
jgi:hypothetical protein